VEEKPKYRQFPHVMVPNGHGGKRREIDYDRLKEIYLEGPDFDWAPFCKRNGFSPNSNRNKWKQGHDFNDWKKEWLRNQVHLQDDSMAVEVLDLRKSVAQQRVKFVKDWTKRAEFMKVLMDAMLKKHGDALQHDMANTLAIQAGRVQPKFRMGPDELGEFAMTACRLQELEQKALLLTSDKMNHPQIGDQGQVDHGDDEPRTIEVSTMGAAGMSAAETARMLANWFDQAPEKDGDGEANTG
jgi:hypothetical protein